MQIRIIRLRNRHPLVGAALLLGAAAVVLALIVLGLALIAGLAAVGGVALLARRLLGARRRPTSRPTVLDPAQEIVAYHRVDVRGALPPLRGRDDG
jgi:hypothetical protein